MKSCKKSSVIALSSMVLATWGSQAHAEDSRFDWSAIKPGFTLQTWLVNDTTVTAAKPDFRIRRAEIRFAGSFNESTRWFVMADMAKYTSSSDPKFLQDLGVTFTLLPGLEFTAGQFKILTTSEGLERSAELILPERSIFGRKYGDRREQGAMLNYKIEKLQVGAMVSNDTGPNLDDTNGEKDLTIRADYEVGGGLRVGAFTEASNFSYGQNGRYGANVRFGLGDFYLTAEGGTGTYNSATSNGGQVTVAYMINPIIQPVARYETFTPDTKQDHCNAGTVGVNFYIVKNNAKIQAAYSYLNNMRGNNATGNAVGATDYALGTSGSVAWLVFQAAL